MRNGLARAVTAAAAAVALMPLPAHAAGFGPGWGSGSDYTTDCPPAESLVAGSSWSTHALARGVTLRETTRADDEGEVRLHVLRVSLTTPRLSVRPLVGSLARRVPLSTLARGRRGLVAATNAGYFDFTFGTPTVPLVDRGRAYVASTAPAQVVGINTNGLAQAGSLVLDASVSVGTSRRRVDAVNVLRAPTGITVYTSRWGRTRIPLPGGTTTRTVVSGVIASAVGTAATVPAGGTLLAARGAVAQSWLRSLPMRKPVTYRNTVTGDRPAAYRTAFGVGTHLVVAGRALSGMSCRIADPLPARTTIGYTRGGASLLLVEAEQDLRGWVHGLDNDQMARVMHDLGAVEAYQLDGSGSTELLARMAARSDAVCQRTNVSGLSCRTHPADGEERPMPVGIGIFAG